MCKIQITNYQLIYADGRRDTVKLQQPHITDKKGKESYRKHLKESKDAAVVNLTYTEIE